MTDDNKELLTFVAYGHRPVTVTKEEGEKLLRKKMADDRVDLILLNVLAGRPMTFVVNGTTFVLKLTSKTA